MIRTGTWLAGVAILLGVGRAAAGDNTWTNAAANGVWNTTSVDWTSPTVWSNANVDDAIFGATGAGAISVSSAITVHGLKFNANNYILNSPNILTLTSGGTGNSLGVGEIQVAGGFTATINAAIVGVVGLNKTNTGTLILAGPNAYFGTTIVAAGTLTAGIANALPSGNALTIGSPAGAVGLFNTGNFAQSIGGLTIYATTNGNGSTILNVGTGTLTLNGNVNLVDNASAPGNAFGGVIAAGAGGALNLGGAISNITVAGQNNSVTPGDLIINAVITNGGINFTGNPSDTIGSATGMTLGASAPNTYTLGTTVNAGTLNVVATTSLGTGGLTLTTSGTVASTVVLNNAAQTITSLQTGALGTGVATLTLNGTVLTVNQSTTTTFAGVINGSGALIKAGSGTLLLSGSNGYAGGTTIANGVLAVASDGALGVATAPVTLTAFGTLIYTGTTSTARMFTLNQGTLGVAAGQTLTLSGSAIGGGFLTGPGTTAMTGGSLLTGVTTQPNAAINQMGTASFVNVTNGGTLTISPGLTSSMTGFTNQGSGAITFGANSQVNASNFQTYGLLTLANGSGTTKTLLTNTGTAPLYFNGGSRTFIGTIGGNGLAQLELNGQNAIVAGGLFVNNGVVTDNSAAGVSTIVADYGALVKGGGQYDNSPITQNGGKFQAGNSPGVASVGRFVFGPGGVSNYVLAIDDATGAAGPTPDALGHVSGWGLVKAAIWQRAAGPTSGDFVWTANVANPLTVAIDTLVNPTTVGIDVPGLMADFDPTRSYSWPAVEWTGAYSGPTDVASLDAATNFDTSGFANPINGTFGWSLSVAQVLNLSYTPSAVPEPGTMALVGAAAAFGWWKRRRFVISRR